MKKIYLNFVILFIFTLILNADKTLEDKLKKLQNELKESKQKKEEIFKKIYEKELQSQKLKSEENKLLKTISELDKKIYKTKRNIEEIQLKLEITKTNIELLEKDIANKNIEIEERKKLLMKNLLNTYDYILQNDRIKKIYLYLMTDELTDIGKKTFYLNEISFSENNIINLVKDEKTRITIKKNELEEQNKIYEENNRLLTIELNNLTKAKNEKNKFLKEINLSREKTLQLIKELKEQDRMLTKILDELTVRMKETEEQIILSKSNFLKRKGKLPYPIKNPVIEKNFGVNKLDKFDNIKVLNNGIDFRVNKESEIYAISNGKILFADYFEGYGYMVIIDHGGGYRSIYSNLDEITVKYDEEVLALSLIGKIIADKNEPKIFHFEIREGSKALNPNEWLKRR
ncbi:MAG TPA: peptidoglycan DD-metalloendopeptidase family protein [bacterium]|nr:peptidoglycan DD-metalloendopeptidase family protein [bacterium]HOL47254.1 peptidoglycan DD-metalloendopeptidase family protein [bacterium]HPQ19290.1 peptidoglycan DD-metalloendopeptidase family protein [bacterium]